MESGVVMTNVELERLIQRTVKATVSAMQRPQDSAPKYVSSEYILDHPERYGIGSDGTLRRRRDAMANDPNVDETKIYHKEGKAFVYDREAFERWLMGEKNRKTAEAKLDPRLIMQGREKR